MAKITGLDFNTLTRRIASRLRTGINRSSVIYKDFVEQISPEDTSDYVINHKIRPAKREWDTIVWSVYNDSEHAFWVEFGFRKSPVNWSKQDGVTIYNWIWAKVYMRAEANPRLQEKIQSIISQALAWS